tara:strand:+ start:206 stop:436 length:231 start_codon:yes stop_codon:yes gene_type:complete
MNITKEEQRIIKLQKVLPQSVILKRLEELRNDLENASPENFPRIQEFIKELKYWLSIIKMIEKKVGKKKGKKDTGV